MPQTLRRLLAEGRLRRHRTSTQEIAGLFQAVERNLADARVLAISLHRPFTIAYEAALLLATAALYCKGYETHGAGHHATTFEVLPAIMGRTAKHWADYFEICRTKRSATVYDRAGVVSETEVEDLLKEVQSFKQHVRQWLKENYPQL